MNFNKISDENANPRLSFNAEICKKHIRDFNRAITHWNENVSLEVTWSRHCGTAPTGTIRVRVRLPAALLLRLLPAGVGGNSRGPYSGPGETAGDGPRA